MSRITVPLAEHAPAESQPILDQVRKNLGFVPNLHRLMAISPPVLQGWFSLMGSLSKTLDLKTRDGIALAVSAANGCEYCLAAHTYVSGKHARLTAEEMALNREGSSSDPKRAAAIHFAKRLIETRGKVDTLELDKVRAAGFTDAQVVEIVGSTAQFLLTNFMNNVNDTLIDFPVADAA